VINDNVAKDIHTAVRRATTQLKTQLTASLNQS